MDQQKTKTNELARGVRVFIALAVLTVIEYFLGMAEAPAILLAIIAVIKAGLVIWYFMHIFRLFQSEGGH